MSGKKKTFEARKDSLKLDIIKFLDQHCDSKRCLRAEFWNRLSRYTKKTICHSKFGVSKMSNIFPEFQDILQFDERFVYLRPDYNLNEAILVNSDSENSEEKNDLNNSASSRTKASILEKGSTPWGSGLSVTPVTGSRSKPLEISDNSDDDDDDDELVADKRNRNTSTLQSKDSGFISFAEGSLRDGSGQFSHQRYGLPPNKSPMTAQTNPTIGSAQFMNSKFSVQAMAQNFLAQFSNTMSRSSQDLTLTGNNMSSALNSQTSLLGPVPSTSIARQQQQQAQQGNFLVSMPAANPLMTMNMAASGAMAAPPPPQPVVSEWPQQKPRTGPPPGTKITEPVPDIIVRPISLPPNSRLTSQQVNSEIETCRQVLAEAGEHVSLERVHNLVLQKFQVTDFRRLNLGQKFFDNMPAARDLSMLLGKVNSYIQNFVRSRSMCTLYELGECCREFHPEKKSFDHLQLGPLQKMPLVYDLFKFPYDEYIPEITTVDLMEHLNQYLTKYQKWTAKNQVSDFMQYLCEEAFKVESAFSLGIRMRSLPLAIQTMKKAQRDSAATRRNIMESLREVLNRDVHDAFAKFRATLLQTSTQGQHELRQHYLNLTPEVAIREIFTKFELLSHVFASDHSTQRKLERLHKTFQSFVSVVLEMPIPRMLYHLSVCLSNLEIHDSAAEFMEQQQQQQQQQQAQVQQAAQHQHNQQDKKIMPTKAKLIEKLLSYLHRCLESGQMQLTYLKTIEEYLIRDFQVETFSEMGYGRFLELLLKEPKLTTILEECGGTMLGSSSKGHHIESSYKPGLAEVQELLCQANHAGLTQPQQMESVLCEQYHITNIRQLGHGNSIDRLWRSAQGSRKHSSREQNVHYEAALCGKLGRATCFRDGNVGILGSQTREAAEACLTLCPLLEDMAAWSQWGLVFQPQFGPLRVFVEKYGGQRVLHLKGKLGVTATSDFMGLEVEPGQLLKICTFSGPEQFEDALLAEDPRLAAGHLVSLIVTNKGVEGAPLALLANHVKNTLLTLHARSSAFSTPGGPPSLESQKSVDLAVQFVVQMLVAIPLRICVAVAEQVFLKPLSEAVGSDKSKAQVVLACQTRPQDLQRLEQLGCLLGITEWCSSLQLKLEFPSQYCMAENVPGNEELFDLGADEEEENEEDENEESDENSDEDSDMEDILCQEEETDNAEKPLSTGETSTTALNDTNNSSLNSAKDEPENSNKSSDSSEEADTDSSEDDDCDEDDNETHEKEKQKKDKIDSPASDAEDKIQENNGDQNVDQVGKAIEVLTVSNGAKEMTREQICHGIVDNIRREEFGVGIELGETEQKLMKKQQERQGRSLLRLSKDLYSKDTHFVLELIQNADDNSYPTDVVPSVKFVIDHSGVKVMNNESGFEAKNIQALCDVGKSTKTKHTIGYIGQKGIGFKSVFRVTGRPEVHSNGFHICFDVDSGPMGYILPHWIDPPDTTEVFSDVTQPWQTLISLPWTQEIKQQLHTHAARFNDIKPSLLLFLHRLREITIDNKVDGVTISMKRKDLGDGEIQITHSGTTDRWLVVRKVLDASKVSIQMKAGVEVDSTEIALSFPLRGKKASTQVKPPMLPVFAFLPLRTYGFRFIVQGDFDVPSSREDVDKDSSWNQWLRSEIHNLFIEALEAFKNRPDLTPLEALVQYLQFVPLENEVVDFFKPVTTHILAQLRASKCMPVLNADGKDIKWKLPSQCVFVRDSLMQEVVSPKLLEHRLGLHYLHPELANVLDQPLADVLKVQTINTSHLLDIGGFISQNWDGQGHPDQVMEVAKWLACIYRSLDDFEENADVLEKLNKMRVIPLADGTLVALADVTVFLLMENTGPASKQSSQKSARKRDPLKELQKDLKIVHAALTSTPDAEINSQVVKLLLRTGKVKQQTAHDLIHIHIVPVLSSDSWKSKSREIIISYLVYMKSELDRQPNLIELSELKSAVRLATNHGILSPQDSSVHFSTAFGNKIDLPNTFPGVEWTLIDAAYLPPNPTANEKQSWHGFLTELGVVDFLHLKPVEVQFDKSTIGESPWAIYKDLWVDSPEGYVIADYECNEFHQLVSTALNPNYAEDRAIRELRLLFELLDAHWSTQYKKYTLTQLRSGSGQILKEVIETSFALHLKTLPWVPAEWSIVDEDGKKANISSKQDLCKASDLYVDCPEVRKRLSHTVKYLMPAAQSNSHFIDFLGIKKKVTAIEAKEAFISWCKRHPDKPNTPATFCTTWNHIFELYSMIENELVPKEAQDVFHNHPAIFVPMATSRDSYCGRNQVLVGRMMARNEVWWHDPTGLFAKYHKSLQNYKSLLGSKSTLQLVYGNEMEFFFRHTVRSDWEPTTLHLAELLKHVASTKTLFEEDTLEDCLSLFSHIGARLTKIGEKVAGVPSHEASCQEAELQPVLSLLCDAAVFPSHHREWINPSQQLLMLPDSTQLEEMFRAKPEVHFLLTDLPKNSKGMRTSITKHAIQHFVSLFERIKPLSECVTTQEITTGFQQCSSGQTYLHKVVGLIQRFLYFVFPDVYMEVKPGRAEALKQLIFAEVNRLEAKYELEGHPEIYVIQPEKCMVKDNMFYFHQAHSSSQAEINREIAKYFSSGNKSCLRGLLNFLTQAVPIIEGKSEEPMESLLARQEVRVGDLPEDEDVWEVPLPVIQEPEPEPEPDFQDSQMVYGRELDPGYDNSVNKDGAGDNAQSEGMKSWPPRSALNVNDSQQRAKKDSDKSEAPAGMWPPPKPPNSSRSAKTLPSNIRVEREPSQEEGKDGQGISDATRAGATGGGRGSLSHQNSYTGETQNPKRRSYDSDESDERHRARENASSDCVRDHSNKERVEQERDGSSNTQLPSLKTPSLSEDPGSLEKRKRKASESLREGEPAVTKRFNSQTDEDTNRERRSFSRNTTNSESGPSEHVQGRRDSSQDASSQDRSASSSTTDVTSSSSGMSQDSPSVHSKDKRRMHFTIPMWNELNQDLQYTDLSKDVSAKLPSLDLQDLEREQGDQNITIGRWGEMLVLDYLIRLKDSDSSIEAVLWANAEGEKGLPWDFELVYYGMEGPEDSHTVYIEVKTTVSQDREIFEVSRGQVELALKEGQNFQVYRVFGAGKSEPRLLRVDNVAERMRTKQLKLYMVL